MLYFRIIKCSRLPDVKKDGKLDTHVVVETCKSHGKPQIAGKTAVTSNTLNPEYLYQVFNVSEDEDTVRFAVYSDNEEICWLKVKIDSLKAKHGILVDREMLVHNPQLYPNCQPLVTFVVSEDRRHMELDFQSIFDKLSAALQANESSEIVTERSIDLSTIVDLPFEESKISKETVTHVRVTKEVATEVKQQEIVHKSVETNVTQRKVASNSVEVQVTENKPEQENNSNCMIYLVLLVILLILLLFFRRK